MASKPRGFQQNIGENAEWWDFVGQAIKGDRIGGAIESGLLKLTEARQGDRFTNPAKDPTGWGSKMSADLGMALQASGKDNRLEKGFDSALDVLSQRGAQDQRITNAEKLAIERQRQMTQQDIDQRSGSAGLSDAVGTDALKFQANRASVDAQNQASMQREFDAADRYRGDLGSILGGMIQNPGLELATGRTPVAKDERKTGLGNLFGTFGNLLGAYGSMAGGK